MGNIYPHSYTRVSLAMKCPAAYRFYLDRTERGIENELLQVGSFVHEFAEAYTKHLIATQQTTDVMAALQIAGWVYDAMRADYAARNAPFLGRAEADAAISKLIIPFVDNHVFDVDRIAEVESLTAVDRELRPCAWDAPDAWFRARFDLLVFPTDTTARITDYKTGFNPEADPLQGQIYSWLLLQIYPQIESVEVELDYVRFNVQKYVTYTRAQWPWLNERIQGLCAYAESLTAFDAAPGLHCLHCDYRAQCTAKANVPGAVTTLADAQQAIEAISLLSRDLDDAKERLRPFCVENGPVEHNGVVWGIHAQGGMGYDDAAEFIAAAEENEIDPKPYLKVDNQKCNSKKAQAALKAIEHLRVNKRSLKFYGKKAGEE